MQLHIFPNYYIKNVFKKNQTIQLFKWNWNEINQKTMEICFCHWEKKTKQIKKQNKEISQIFKTMTWNLDLALQKKPRKSVAATNSKVLNLG